MSAYPEAMRISNTNCYNFLPEFQYLIAHLAPSWAGRGTRFVAVTSGANARGYNGQAYSLVKDKFCEVSYCSGLRCTKLS